jgi:hypothetical protein
MCHFERESGRAGGVSLPQIEEGTFAWLIGR